jgi:hypothetical protein
MTQLNAENSDMKESKLPRRDWILLPLISIFTIFLLAAATDLVSRTTFTPSKTGPSDCMRSYPGKGVQAIPNSVCWNKGSEGELTEYRFNNCGQRADFECKPKAANTYRIVMIGSSFAMGDRVANSDSLAALLPAELSQQTGRKVELYNQGMLWGLPHSFWLRFDDVLAAQPDMILWPTGPWDIQNATVVLPYSKSSFDKKDAHQLSSMSFTGRIRFSIGYFVRNIVPPSVTADIAQIRLMLQHYLYESQSLYIDSYLLNASDAGFLAIEPDAEWKTHLADFETYSARMEERAAAAHVPFVVVLVPNRAQAAMISMGEWPAGYDPYQLGNELRAIVTTHGGVYIDILPGFRDLPNPEQYYFPVDGHPDARGHAIIAGLIDKALITGAAPELSVANQPQAVPARDK